MQKKAIFETELTSSPIMQGSQSTLLARKWDRPIDQQPHRVRSTAQDCSDAKSTLACYHLRALPLYPMAGRNHCWARQRDQSSPHFAAGNLYPQAARSSLVTKGNLGDQRRSRSLRIEIACCEVRRALVPLPCPAMVSPSHRIQRQSAKVVTRQCGFRIAAVLCRGSNTMRLLVNRSVPFSCQQSRLGTLHYRRRGQFGFEDGFLLHSSFVQRGALSCFPNCQQHCSAA